MNEEEKERLIKLLNLTTSDSDGEALNAIRAANRILKKYDLTFSDIILKAPPAQAPVQQPTYPWGQDVDLSEILRRRHESQRAQATQSTENIRWYYYKPFGL